MSNLRSKPVEVWAAKEIGSPDAVFKNGLPATYTKLADVNSETSVFTGPTASYNP